MAWALIPVNNSWNEGKPISDCEYYFLLTLDFFFNTYPYTRSGAREERKREPRLNRGRARRCNPALFSLKRELF